MATTWKDRDYLRPYRRSPRDLRAPPHRTQQGEGKISKLILMRRAKVAIFVIEFLLCFRRCVGHAKYLMPPFIFAVHHIS